MIELKKQGMDVTDLRERSEGPGPEPRKTNARIPPIQDSIGDIASVSNILNGPHPEDPM